MDVNRVAIFKITSPLTSSKDNRAQLFLKCCMVHIRGVHLAPYPRDGVQDLRVLLHKHSSIGVVRRIRENMEGTIQVRVAEPRGIDKGMFEM